MTKHFPNCICCNPLFNEFVTQLSRRRFLLGTGAFTTAVLTGNRENQSVKAQTEVIRLLGNDKEAIEELNRNGTIYIAKKVITMEKDQPSAKAVGVIGGLRSLPHYSSRKLRSSQNSDGKSFLYR